jgi:hypothetical protein
MTSDADTIRETARNVLARPHFQVAPTSDDGGLLDLLLRVFRWLMAPLVALFQQLADISPVLAWGIVTLVVLVLIALVAHIGYTFMVALRRRSTIKAVGPSSVEQTRDPAELERLAEAANGAKQYGQAARLLLLASLLRLELAQEARFRPGTTNHEHLRRYRGSSIFEPLESIVDLIDRTWYGGGVCLAENFMQCRQAYTLICQSVEEPARAQRT